MRKTNPVTGNTNRVQMPSLVAAATLFILLSLSVVRGGLAADAPKFDEQAVVQHVTIIWLKEPGNAEHRKRMVEGIRLLAKIPGVKSVTIGSAIPPARNPSDPTRADSSFDLSAVVTLENEKAYAAYIKHPIHDLMARSTMAPLIDHYRMYDVDLIE